AVAQPAHAVAVQDVQRAVLAAADHQVLDGARGVVQHHRRATRAEVLVAGAVGDRVRRCEPGIDRKRRTELQEAVAVVVVGGRAAGDVEHAVAGDDVDIAGIIDRRSTATHPDPGLAGVRCGEKRPGLRQGVVRIRVGDHPADPGIGVLVRGPDDVDRAVGERESRALILRPRLEGAVAECAGEAGGDGYRRAGLLVAGEQVDRVQALVEGGAGRVHRLGYDIEDVGRRVDHRRADDANFRCQTAQPYPDLIAGGAGRYGGLA